MSIDYEEEVKKVYPDAIVWQIGFIGQSYRIVNEITLQELSGWFSYEELAWQNAHEQIKNGKV